MAAVEGLDELHAALLAAARRESIVAADDMAVSTGARSGSGSGTESPLPGFTSVTDQIYIQTLVDPADADAEAGTARDPSHPDTVMIFGWGDARPRHVAKYVEGYKRLFPHARIVLVFSPILRALLAGLEARTSNMAPVVEAVFPTSESESEPATRSPENNDEKADEGVAQAPRQKILAHVMSNTGGINYAAMLNAHVQRRHGEILRHDLVVLDSTPGSSDFFPNVGRWSRAMAIGAANALPIPFLAAQAVAAGFLGAMHFAGWMVGRVSAAEFSVGAVNNPAIADVSTRRLYLYSKEDDIIHWEDIEWHANDAAKRGFVVDSEIFEGTPHVGHMRRYPERYWDAIAESWKKVVEAQQCDTWVGT